MQSLQIILQVQHFIIDLPPHTHVGYNLLGAASTRPIVTRVTANAIEIEIEIKLKALNEEQGKQSFSEKTILKKECSID